MSRPVVPYSKEVQAVMDMKGGEKIKFTVRHPWGLAHKIYDKLRLWGTEEYYDLRILTKKGNKCVIVKKERVRKFAWDDDYDEHDEEGK